VHLFLILILIFYLSFLKIL